MRRPPLEGVADSHPKRSRLIEFSLERLKPDRKSAESSSLSQPADSEAVATEETEPADLPSRLGYFEAPPINKSRYAENEQTKLTFAIA